MTWHYSEYSRTCHQIGLPPVEGNTHANRCSELILLTAAVSQKALRL
uniref:Uncharacterized protein n=1 Tax=Anguilla anguilla TaxID=7936 RepID=A0A0E9VWR6_ANGAN